MDAVAIRAALGPGRFADVRVIEEIDSTNRALLAWAAVGHDDDGGPVGDGTVLIARSQTAGRGRLGRRWIAPVDSALLMSVLVLPGQLPVERWPLLSFAMGLAVVDACREVGVDGIMLKWPNDVVIVDPDSPVGYRKLAGILAESSVAWGAGRVVVGVGVNLQHPTTLDPNLGPEAVPSWLSEHVGRVEPTTFTANVLTRFDHHATTLPGDVLAFLDAYRQVSATIGRRVRADLGTRQETGLAVDVDPLGRLIVRDDAAALHTLSSGDVIHLRPEA
jgi:BirA family transcriptional regulator, biotin operon repressor / biotin---[acetyl-CoA-carboxylase] ligase